MIEQWRPIPGYPAYEVSDLGSVRSIDRVVPGSFSGRRRRTGVAIKPVIGFGYARAKVYQDGRARIVGVHRLVLLAFGGPPPEGDYEARHVNGDPLDNRASNLRWGTPTDNAADRDRHGNTLRGSRNGSSKLTDEQVIAIRQETGSRRAIAARFGISGTHVQRIRSGERWSHLAASEAPHDD